MSRRLALPLGTLLVLLPFADPLQGQGHAPPAKEQKQQDTGPMARIRLLIERLDDKKLRWPAWDELLRIGEPAVKPLLEVVMREGEVEESNGAFRILDLLAAMGPHAAKAYGPLSEAVGKCEPEPYLKVLDTLATLAPYGEVRGDQAAVRGIVQAGIQVIRNFDREQRTTWSRTYQRFSQRIMVDPDAGLEAMIAELVRNRPYRREVAAEVLGRMGPKAREAVPLLAACLRGDRVPRNPARGGVRVRVLPAAPVGGRNQDYFKRAVAEALVKIAPGDKESVVAWAWLVRNAQRANQRASAALRLGSFGAAAKDHLRALMRATTDKNLRVRCEAVTALGMIGPTADVAVPGLKLLADSDIKQLAARAKAALRQIQPEGKAEKKKL